MEEHRYRQSVNVLLLWVNLPLSFKIIEIIVNFAGCIFTTWFKTIELTLISKIPYHRHLYCLQNFIIVNMPKNDILFSSPINITKSIRNYQMGCLIWFGPEGDTTKTYCLSYFAQILHPVWWTCPLKIKL
jgi:hypothetical protein